MHANRGHMPKLRNIKHVQKAVYGYLLPNGYVERVSRGIYEITEKGEKLLEILNWLAHVFP